MIATDSSVLIDLIGGGEQSLAAAESVRQALYASKIISYAQGFVQLQEASRAVETVLEVSEVLTGRYRLEVSSPGIDRPWSPPIT